MLVSGYSGSSPFAMVHALPRTAGLVPANSLGWIEQRPGEKLSARAMALRLVEAVDSYYNDFSVHLKEPDHLPVFFPFLDIAGQDDLYASLLQLANHPFLVVSIHYCS
ncbi:hypothetical protein J3458_002319 [Metarhizium acridum]|uniref:uncharacterized protein n=1 Tax=Metarhizium acridum TaxID=92637 RepID=UPI001C6C1651|nr:hypothetical protein J3458_002319 [Metarhizium acridum]